MKSYHTNAGAILPITEHPPQHIEVLALEILSVSPEGMTMSVLAADAPSLSTVTLRLDWQELIEMLNLAGQAE